MAVDRQLPEPETIMSKYEAIDSKIYRVFSDGERDLRATAKSHGVAIKAAEILNRADALNDKRKYTASARLHAEVESMAVTFL